MSVPFPMPDVAQPFAPLGAPLPTSSSYGYLSVPSPAPYSGHRSRTHSQPSAHGHHHSSSGDHGHHSRSEHRSRDEHHSHSRSHSHGRSHSHSRSRHHSHSVPAPPPLTTHYSEPWTYQQPPLSAVPLPPQSHSYSYTYGYAPSMPHMTSYGPPASIPPGYAPIQPSVTAQTQVPHSMHQPFLGMPVPNPELSIPRGPLHKGRAKHAHSRSQQSQLRSDVPLLAQEVSGHRRHAFMHPLFHYSRCTGRKKAVCIGINYTGTEHELRGCVNDATNMYRFLNEKYGFDKGDMLYLVDTSHNPRGLPTRAHIIQAMKWLVQDAEENDSLFFHFSGHGGQIEDQDGDEADGLDEVIFPLDYEKKGVITDDELHDLLVHPLPPGCRLTALFDSCHSGSILDLPYLYNSNGRSKKSDVSYEWRERRISPADVITWSGSTDAQTSADTYQNGLAVGAMSHAFMKVLKRNPRISYKDLLQGVRDVLKAQYSQIPQLSSSHRIDTGLQFII